MISGGCVTIHGEIQEHVSIKNRGFSYADGFFTTVRVHNGTLQLWQEHVQRCERGAHALYLDIVISDMTYRAKKLAQQMVHGVLKIHITRVPSLARGYGTDSAGLDMTDVLFFCFPSPVDTATLPIQNPINITCLDMCLGHVTERLSGVKTLARTEQVLASKALQLVNSKSNADMFYNDALLFDVQHNVVESINSNIFFQLHHDKKNIWYTPQLHNVGVAGTLRAYLLHRQQDVAFSIGNLTHESLPQVKAMFLTNAVKGITPIHNIRLRNGQIHTCNTNAVHYMYQNINHNISL